MSNRIDLKQFDGATPGPRRHFVRGDGSIGVSIGDPVNGPHSQADWPFSEPEAKVFCAAPTLRAELRRMYAVEDGLRSALSALTVGGWSAQRASLYDEEGVEGWTFTHDTRSEFSVIGNWSEPPEFDADTIKALEERGS